MGGRQNPNFFDSGAVVELQPRRAAHSRRKALPQLCQRVLTARAATRRPRNMLSIRFNQRQTDTHVTPTLDRLAGKHGQENEDPGLMSDGLESVAHQTRVFVLLAVLAGQPVERRRDMGVGLALVETDAEHRAWGRARRCRSAGLSGPCRRAVAAPRAVNGPRGAEDEGKLNLGPNRGFCALASVFRTVSLI